VFVSDVRKPVEALEAVGVYRGTGCYVSLRNAVKVAPLKSDDCHASATTAAIPFLHGHQHQRCLAAFELSTSAQAGLRAANSSIITFHFASQRLSWRVDHCAPEFMQHHPCSFVTTYSELALQQ
jgi:hypothetical protein